MIALSAVAVGTDAGTANAADGTWDRVWGRDVIQTGAPGDLGNVFEICIVAGDCKNGTGGGLGGEFSTPLGVATDSAGNVYVADSGGGRIQKFDPSGSFLLTWGQDVIQSLAPGDTGTGFEVCTVAADCKLGAFGGGLGGELSLPQDVAVDAAGNVYVAEGQRIQKFGSNGTWERAWGKDVVTGGGTGFEICTVAADCKLGDLNGELGGEFRGPNGVAAASDGSVYVGDEVRQRVQKFDSNGTWERAWGKDVVTGGGTGFEVCTVAANCKQAAIGGLGGEFNSPRRMGVDATGDVFVGDIGNQRVQKFASDGTWERAWGKDVVTGGGIGFEICTVAANCQPGGTGGLAGEFVNPIGIALDGAGDVYVADRDNMRIQRFDSSGVFVRTWGNDVVQEDRPGDIDPNGFEICTVAADCEGGDLGNGLGGEVPQPDGVAADAAGNVYVVTPGAQRTQKFVETPTPNTPAITDTDPDSPANDNDPEVKGTVGAGSSATTVKIYKDNAACAGAPDATATVAAFTGSGITVNVPDDSTTALRATAVNSIGEESGCSAAFNYAEESTPPANTSPPVIGGEPVEGETLNCNAGTWTGGPSFTFRWLRDGVPIPGATGPTYTLTADDVGKQIVCRVVATNSAGTGEASSSPITPSAKPAGPSSPPPSNPIISPSGCLNTDATLSGTQLGPARLGRRLAEQRAIFQGANRQTRANLDRFCAEGGGNFRIGYPTPRLTRTLSRSLARKVKDRVVIVLTSSPRFSLAGIEVGDSVAAARSRLARERAFRIGSNTWYAARRGSARLLVKTKGGSVREIGIGDPRLSTTARATKRFLNAWKIG